MSKKPYKAEGWGNVVVNDADGNTLVACVGSSTLEEAKANAALFAAAPELLEALREYTERQEAECTAADTTPAGLPEYDKAINAIRKATNV